MTHKHCVIVKIIDTGIWGVPLWYTVISGGLLLWIVWELSIHSFIQEDRPREILGTFNEKLWNNRIRKANHYCSSRNTGVSFHLGWVGDPNRISLDRKTIFFVRTLCYSLKLNNVICLTAGSSVDVKKLLSIWFHACSISLSVICGEERGRKKLI